MSFSKVSARGAPRRAARVLAFVMVWAVVLSAVPLSSSSTEPRPPDSATIFVIAGRLHGGPGIGQTVEMTVGLGTPSWSSHAGLPNPHYAIGGASVGGRIVVVGGYNESALSYHNETYVFDPVTDVWSRAADAPSKMAFPAVVGFGGRLYAFGGLDGVNKLNTTYVFDLATGGWTRGADMPLSIDRSTAVVFAGKIWVLGGATMSSDVSNVSIYDPAANSWAAGPAMPQVRNSLSAAALGGKIYVVGGHQQPGTYLNTVSVYDPTSGWSSGPAMPTARSELVTVAAGGYLYAIAGQAGPTAVTANVDRYDPASNTWSGAPSIPTGVTGPAAVVLVPREDVEAPRIFALGGVFQQSLANSGQNAELALGASPHAWINRSALPVPRAALGVASVGGQVVAFGGYNYTDQVIYNRTDIYDPATNTWRTGAPYPINAQKVAVATYQGKIYSFGGWSGPYWPNASYTSGAYEYDIVSDTWRTLAPLPAARVSAIAVAFNGKIWVMGGMVIPDCVDIRTAVDVYDPVTDSWSSGPALPVPRTGTQAAVAGGRIYIPGGQNVPCSPTPLDTLLEYDPASGWSSKATMPTARNWASVVAAQDSVFVVGGFNTASTSSAAVERYDPSSNAWFVEPALPAAAGDLGATVLAEAGSEAGERASGVWRTGAPMPAGRSAPAMVSVGDDVYVMTGYNYSSTNWRYNVRSNGWTNLASAPASFGAGAAAYWNGKIYLAGGFNGGPLSGLYIYDIFSNSWSTGASLPSGRPEFDFLTLGDRIYAFGGSRGAETSYAVYDPTNNSWGGEIPMPQHRAFADGAVINGEAYLVAGVDADTGGQPVRVVQKFSPATSTFTNVTTLPRWGFGSFVASVGSKLFVTGGVDWPTTPRTDLNLVQVYDTATGAWSFGPRFPLPRSYGQAAAVGSVIVTAGGENGSWPMADVHLLSTDPLTEATGSADDTASLILLDDNPADNSGNLSVSVRARDPASAESFARSNVSGPNVVLENEHLKLTGGSGSWFGGDIWRLTALTDKVAGVTHSDAYGNQVIAVAAQNTADTSFTYTAGQNATHAWIFFDRLTGGYEYNLTVSVRPGDPYLTLNGTVTNHNPTAMTVRTSVGEFHTAVAGDLGDDKWFIPGAGPGTFTGNSLSTAHPSVNAGYFAMWDTNDEVGVGVVMSAVPDTIYTYDYYNQCACIEGIDNIATPVAFAAGEVKAFDTTRILLFQGAGPEKTRELYYRLYPGAPGRSTHAWADANSAGIENDVLALRGGPWSGQNLYWAWDHLNNKDAGVNQTSVNRLLLIPEGTNGDVVPLNLTAVDLLDRSVLFVNVTTTVQVFNYTFTVWPGKPYVTIEGRIRSVLTGQLWDPPCWSRFGMNVGSDSFDDSWFAEGIGSGTFTAAGQEVSYGAPAAGYFAMWDPAEHLGVGFLTPDRVTGFTTYDYSFGGQMIHNIYAVPTGNYGQETTCRQDLMVYTGSGPKPVDELYHQLYFSDAELDATRHVANLSSIGSAFTYAANSTYRLSVTGAWADGATPGAARLLEYNRDLPGYVRTLYAGIEYGFVTGASTSKSYFTLLDQDPSNNTGALFVTLSTPGSTPLRVTVDAAANAVNLTKYALPFRLAANGLWDIRVTGNWSDGGTNVSTVWVTTSSPGGDLASTLFPPPVTPNPRIEVFVSPAFRRGELVTIGAVYVGAGSNLTFLVRDPSAADLLIAVAPVTGGVATITFRLANDAVPGVYGVVVTAVDASATGSFRVKVPGQVVLGVITVIKIVARGSVGSVNVTISNGALDPVTYLIAIQVYNGTRVPWRPLLQTASVPAETEATFDVIVVIPATTPVGTYSMEVMLLTDHPAAGGYGLDSRLLVFDVV